MDSHTNGSMNTNSTPTPPPPAPKQDAGPGWTYEHRLAFYILGKLALQGALSDLPLDEFDYVIDGLVDSITEGLEELRVEDGLEKTIDLADFGRLHQNKGGQS